MGSSDAARAEKMQPDIFISYASKDADRVVPIARLLEKAGVSVWRDGDRILGGQYYGEQITQALTHARVVLLMCSPDSLASDNVHREMLVNWEYGCRAYVPVWITPPIEIPERFRYCLVGCQWIDTHADPPDVWLPRLLSALEALGVRAGAGAARKSRPPARSASQATKKAMTRPRGLQLSWPVLAAATAGVVVVAVVALWAGGVFRSKGSPPVAASAETGTAAVPGTTTVTNPFVSLFNGKDLSGWFVDSGNSGAWQVKNGELCARSSESFTMNPVDLGYLLSDREYKDFHLLFQVRRMTNDANSAIAIRAVPHETIRKTMPKTRTVRPFHLAIWIGKGMARDGSLTGALVWSPDTSVPLLLPRPAELKPLGEWDEMEIEMQGQQLRIIANNRELLNVDLNRRHPDKHPAPGLTRSSGRIGFLKFSSEVRFRNIKIKELN